MCRNRYIIACLKFTALCKIFQKLWMKLDTQEGFFFSLSSFCLQFRIVIFNVYSYSFFCRLSELANQIPAILTMINKMTGNSTVLSSIISMESQMAYQTYSIQKFINKQLQFFNGTQIFFVEISLHFSIFCGRGYKISIILWPFL